MIIVIFFLLLLSLFLSTRSLEWLQLSGHADIAKVITLIILISKPNISAYSKGPVILGAGKPQLFGLMDSAIKKQTKTNCYPDGE